MARLLVGASTLLVRFADAAKQLGGSQIEPKGENLNSSQSRFLFAAFELGDVHASKPSVCGKVGLRPATRLAQLPYALPEANADVDCHGISMGLFFRLNLASRLSTKDGCECRLI